MSYSFNLSTYQLIDISLKMMNIVNITDSSGGPDYQYAITILNMMLKSWEARGIKLWKRRQGAVFAQYNQNSYELGSVTGADNCCLATNYQLTNLSILGSSGSNTITVNSVSGMTTTETIGIELDTLSRFWTTISNINTSTNVITLAANLPSQASLNNTIVSYTTKLNRPLEILRATVFDLTSNSETPMDKLTYDQYFNLPVKNLNYRPVNIYYDRLLNNSLPYTGTLYVIGNPDSCRYIIKFSYYDAISDAINNNDVLDFPQEWLLTIAVNLAVTLAMLGYGKLTEAQSTIEKAESLLLQLESFDSDDEPLSFVINSTNRNAS